MSTSVRTYLVRSGTSASNSTAVALVATTAKTVVGCLGSSTDTISLVGWRVSFNTVTTTEVPALLEIGVTSSTGTNTALTPAQLTGPTLASSATGAGYNFSGEPTYVKLIVSTYMPLLQNTYESWFPLGYEPSCSTSQGLAIRVTSPTTASCYASFIYAE